MLLLALPLHGLTVVYLGFWGPPHFHLGDDDHDHSHGPGLVERHHHPAADATVVAADDDALDAHALEEGALTAWSGALYPAMVSTTLFISPDRTGSGIEPNPASPLQTRFPGPLERPPRPASA